MYVYLLKWFLSDEPSDFTLRAYDWEMKKQLLQDTKSFKLNNLECIALLLMLNGHGLVVVQVDLPKI